MAVGVGGSKDRVDRGPGEKDTEFHIWSRGDHK